MHKHLKLALIGSAALSLVLVLAARNSAPTPAVESQYQARVFDAAWRESAGPVALKTASLADTAPKPILTEVVLPEIIAKPEELTPKLKSKLVVYHPVKRDVCQRHGKRKVYRGRGWRCR